MSIIAAPTDSALLIHGAAAGMHQSTKVDVVFRLTGNSKLGYPTANVPLGILSYNGRAYGTCLIAKAGEEEALLRFMNIYESTLPPRPIPDLGKLAPIAGLKNIESQ